MELLLTMVIIPMLVTMITPPVNFPALLLEKFKKESKPINHSLQKAIKIAYLKALVKIAENITRGEIQSFRLHQPGKLQEKIKEWWAEIKTLPGLDDMALIDPPVQNTEEIEQLLLSHGQLSHENIRELERRLVNQALADIGDLPEKYQEQVKTGLFKQFYRHFMEELAVNQQAFQAFQLDYLLTINQSLKIVLTMQDLFGQIVPSLEDLHRDMAEILSRLDPQNPQLTDEEWQIVVDLMLTQQQALTSNLFSSTYGVELNNIDVYVSFGLEERKEKQKVKTDFSPEKFSQNIQEKFTITPISEEHFFQAVLRGGQSPTSQGKRLAIIGEAGSGKTTCLQIIAKRILQENLGLPIWVPLSQLTGSFGLSDFLENWLKNAIGQKNLWSDFQAQFKAGKVWLLLDSLDELTSRVTLDYGYLLQGWWSDARIIVTCRVNVWDNYRESFHRFDVYRNLEFQEDGVKSFIEKFFGKVEQLEAGEELWSILQGENHSRLRDLIGNPLRLFLVCWLWYQGERALPETQAGLYEKLVKQLYRWLPNSISINKEERRLIQKKLSQLALMGINGQDSKGKAIPRFWFCESLVDKVFDDVDDSILQLALRVGLINQIGKVAEQDERAYRFYHTTFQEYFAALGVTNWDYFLPCNHVNFPLKDQQYRIFASEWEQVILLWFGRSDIDYNVKEEFIKKLLSFDDGCGEWNFDSVDKGFYTYQAYFLAGVVVNEFKTCSFVDQIIEQIVKWGFGDFNKEKQHLQAYFYPIAETSKEILLRTLKEKIINNLIQLLESIDNDNICSAIADSLGKIAIGNKLAIRALINTLYTTTDDFFTSYQIIKSLGEISLGNDLVICELINILQTTDQALIFILVADSLQKIALGNDLVIHELFNILHTADNKIRWGVACALGIMDPGNNLVICDLIHILQTSDFFIGYQIALILERIALGNELAISELINILYTTNDDTFILVSHILCKIDPKNELVTHNLIHKLIHILCTNCDILIYNYATSILEKIAVRNELAIHQLIHILQTSNNENHWYIPSILGKIDPGNELAIRKLITILETTNDIDVRRQVASILGKIDPGNELAICQLITILETTNDDDIASLVAYNLEKIAVGNELAIHQLINILETTTHHKVIWRVSTVLGKIDQGNKLGVSKLISILEITDDQDFCKEVIKSLDEIVTDEQSKLIINHLKKYLNKETYENNLSIFKASYETIWNIAQNLTYDEFYQIWHNNLSPLNLAQLPQLLQEQINHHNRHQTCQIFWIDGSKFIDQDNPSLDIYEQLLDQQCQPRPNGEPENLSQLKSYWGQIRRNSDKKTILIFYENPTPSTPQGFSLKFINTLSRFEGAIALIDDNIQSDHIKTFTSQDPNLLENIIDWIKTIS